MIPNHIQKLYEQGRWDILTLLFRRAWDATADKTLVEQRENVEMLKRYFTALTQRPAFKSDNAKWDAQIAKYVAVLGYDNLAEDIRSAIVKYKPQSMLFFIFRADGRTTRWEMLYRRFLEKEYLERKNEYKKGWDDLQKTVNLKAIEPMWVIDARTRHKTLKSMLPTAKIDEKKFYQREITKIENQLTHHGYKID